MRGNRSAPRRTPLLALALGAAVGLTGGGADPATAASTAALTATSPATVAVAADAAASPGPLVVPEPLAVRAPDPVTTAPGVPVSPWQLADPSAGPVAGDVEGDPEAVAVPPSLEVTEALQRLRADAADASTTDLRPAAAALVAMGAALDQVGDPYVWGATGPDAFDCSGLTSWSYGQAGVVIPRVSRDQYTAGGTAVDVDQLLPGDLVFFATADWDPGVVHHVGMYVGHGLMVAAPRPGLTVRVEPVPAADYVGAVRPVPARGHAAERGDEKRPAADAAHRPLPTTPPASPKGDDGPAAPGPDQTRTGPSDPTGGPTGPTDPPAPSQESPTPTATPTAESSPAPTPSATPSATPTRVATVPGPLATAVLAPVGTVTLQPVLPTAPITPLVAPTLVPLSPLLPRPVTP